MEMVVPEFVAVDSGGSVGGEEVEGGERSPAVVEPKPFAVVWGVWGEISVPMEEKRVVEMKSSGLGVWGDPCSVVARSLGFADVVGDSGVDETAGGSEVVSGSVGRRVVVCDGGDGTPVVVVVVTAAVGGVSWHV